MIQSVVVMESLIQMNATLRLQNVPIYIYPIYMSYILEYVVWELQQPQQKVKCLKAFFITCSCRFLHPIGTLIVPMFQYI